MSYDKKSTDEFDQLNKEIYDFMNNCHNVNFGTDGNYSSAEDGADRRLGQQPGSNIATDYESMFKAAFLGRKEVIRNYLNRGFDPFKKDKVGRNVCHHAAAGGHSEIVQLLLDHATVNVLEYDIDERDHKQWTPLLISVCRNFPSVAKLLLDNGADFRLTLDHRLAPCRHETASSSPIHYAAMQGNIETSDALFALGVSPNDRDTTGKTALHYSAYRGNHSYVEYLIKKGATAMAIDNSDRTALHSAAIRGSTDVAKILLQHGCPINRVDVYGMTALHLAQTASHDDLARFLMSCSTLNLREESRHLLEDLGVSTEPMMISIAHRITLSPMEQSVGDAISERLKETEAKDQIYRSVARLGADFCVGLLEKTEEIERNNGQLTDCGKKRRTPGGVFLKLLRNKVLSGEISRKDWDYIRQETKERAKGKKNKKKSCNY